MEYPVYGKLSFGMYYASDEKDLIELFNCLKGSLQPSLAKELSDLYPDVLRVTYNVELTQKEVDLLHLLLGHVGSRTGLALDDKLIPFVSDKMLENYNQVSYSVNSEDGLNIKVNLED